MIRKIVILSAGDWKNIRRDPLLIFSMFGILLLAGLVRFGLPELHVFLGNHTTFNLQEHFPLIVSLVLLMTPLMVGMLYGFVLLDERDEGMLLYYAVTPLTKFGYLICRLVLPVIVTFFLSFAVVLFQGVVDWNLMAFIPIACLLALQAPLITMVMASLASNKVEGLALSKVINLSMLAPLIDYTIKHPIAHLVMIFPMYWPAHQFISMSSGNESFHSIFIGIILTVIWFIGLNRVFQRKIG
ncbi:hypothetical protein KO561_09900 [Radiobacillus kanasensis]|uniref:hypothetical protein n=1 Tax=Radiobacillus kanasensis TaxID=2844358 RepID=UPI001E360219|nr:hypothetical protein [Radiobacillus kanasensis]UFU01224.1 hypothetical protein KO561_09900 [Radiobacillus kanasensis]